MPDVQLRRERYLTDSLRFPIRDCEELPAKGTASGRYRAAALNSRGRCDGVEAWLAHRAVMPLGLPCPIQVRARAACRAIVSPRR
ncbi:MAG: hypothetical protein WDO73_30240 [Ignavibacteriota bacterium]